MKVAHINVSGMNQIAEALGQYHKLGRAHFTPPMLDAWASVAEGHFNNGNGCYFEISGLHTVTGTPIEVTISDDGYDIEEVDDE